MTDYDPEFTEMGTPRFNHGVAHLPDDPRYTTVHGGVQVRQTDHLPECINCRKVESARRDEAYALHQPMTDHLPECMYDLQLICICDRLRACEQRVRAEVMDSTPELTAYRKQQFGYGLDAARNAVAALPFFQRFALGPLFVEEALAAIDALKGDRS